MPQTPGNPEPQYFDMQRDPGNPGPENMDISETLETQNPKILMSQVPGRIHHSIQNFMLSIMSGSSTGDELRRIGLQRLELQK